MTQVCGPGNQAKHTGPNHQQLETLADSLSFGGCVTLCFVYVCVYFSAFRATSNNKVKEMVLLELSYVNSNLQLLMGQLEGLNSSVDVYQNTQ